MLHRFGKFRRPVELVMLSVFLVAQLLLPLTGRWNPEEDLRALRSLGH